MVDFYLEIEKLYKMVSYNSSLEEVLSSAFNRAKFMIFLMKKSMALEIDIDLELYPVCEYLVGYIDGRYGEDIITFKNELKDKNSYRYLKDMKNLLDNTLRIYRNYKAKINRKDYSFIGKMINEGLNIKVYMDDKFIYIRDGKLKLYDISLLDIEFVEYLKNNTRTFALVKKKNIKS